MKTKNCIIGFVAVVLAIGSAVASASTPAQTFIRARNSPTSPLICENLGELCETEGIYSCQITVMVFSGAKTVVGRRLECPLVPTLTHTSTTAIYVPVYYYDVQ